MPALSRMIAGRIAYRGADGVEVGRERFELVEHAGGRILRAFCEMDAIGLLRDVSLSMDADWRPIDAFCRVTTEGQTMGSTWFGVGPSAIATEGMIGGERVHESLPIAAPLAYLGLHPLQGDALVVIARGEAQPGIFVPIAGVTNSISPDGDQGLSAIPVTIDVAFVGYEEVVVAAGSFAARRYALRWHPDWPPADLWVRRDDCVFLKMRWSLIETWYELTDLQER